MKTAIQKNQPESTATASAPASRGVRKLSVRFPAHQHDFIVREAAAQGHNCFSKIVQQALDHARGVCQ